VQLLQLLLDGFLAFVAIQLQAFFMDTCVKIKPRTAASMASSASSVLPWRFASTLLARALAWVALACPHWGLFALAFPH
jgi:thiamine transporter ThiT